MKKTKKISILVLTLSLIIAFSSNAQEKYKLNQDESKLVIKGTSTVHDWEMNAGKLHSEVIVNNTNNKFEFRDVSFSCPVEMILSDNSIMDKKTHTALKASKHPTISFSMSKISSINKNGSSFTGEITGVLKIAGVPKQVTVKFSGEISENKTLKVNGSVPLKMSDFNVEPPTAMLGALKTGNEIEIEYSLHFNNHN